jgi:hypothetical protein
MLVACGGGGRATDVGGLSVQFTAEQSSPPANSVSLQDGGVLDDLATVDVQADAIATLAGSFENGVLVKLRWRAIAAGASTLLFDSPRLADANNIGAQNVFWFGGRLDGF